MELLKKVIFTRFLLKSDSVRNPIPGSFFKNSGNCLTSELPEEVIPVEANKRVDNKQKTGEGDVHDGVVCFFNFWPHPVACGTLVT